MGVYGGYKTCLLVDFAEVIAGGDNFFVFANEFFLDFGNFFVLGFADEPSAKELNLVVHLTFECLCAILSFPSLVSGIGL
jgi:hypothetical protein